jgi:hypothetical protein
MFLGAVGLWWAVGGQQMSLAPRFEKASPLPGLPAVTIDAFMDGVGLAQPMARNRRRQARILWIDATANVERYNTDEKVASLVGKIKAAGFNTVVFDIKPISGQVVYPSKFAPKLTEWRGHILPLDYDPLAAMCREAKRVGLSLLVSLNAFSEGHQMFKVGPGYARPEQQSVVYEARPVVVAADGAREPFGLKADGRHEGTSLSQLPAPGLGRGYVAGVDKDGRVTFRTARADLAKNTVVPAGGILLYGEGAAGEFLHEHVFTGAVLKFDTDAQFVPFGQSGEKQYPLMMNPNDPAVRDYELAIAKEVVTNYPIDGMLYDDRLRYAGMDADFSEQAKSAFEKVVHQSIMWPDDVYKVTVDEHLARGVRPGRFYDQWMAWRASVIRDYLADVRRTIQAVRPGVLLGMYAGSWYGEYPALGNNYASPKTNAGFWFLTPNYRSSGDTPIVDFVVAGCYYKTATIYEAFEKGGGIGSTVEGAARLVNRLVRDEAWTYAGISLADFGGDPDGLAKVLQAACASAEGVMVFDLSHNIEPMWPVFTRAFAERQLPPHADPSILADVRRRRAALDRLGAPDLPIFITSGSSGVGQ